MSNAVPSDARAAVLGVDVGATLCKLALPGRGDGDFHTEQCPANDLDAILATIHRYQPRVVGATGGGGARLAHELPGVRVRTVPEFHAWARGAPILAEREGVTLPERYLLVSLGTGTSVLCVTPQGASRVGGSALGGGTLLGLGQLLLGVSSFASLARLADAGDRRGVDLLVGDIYREGELPLPADLNAAHFAKLDSRAPADVAHALMGLVGENIALICGELARANAAELIVYCGSTLGANPTLQRILTTVTGFYSAPACFLHRGAFCGAVGAAALTPPQ